MNAPTKTVALICITAIMVCAIGLVAVVSATGGDLNEIMRWTANTVGPLIPAMAAYLMASKANTRIENVQDDVGTVQEDMTTVKDQTNGALTAFDERLRRLEEAAGAADSSGQPRHVATETPRPGTTPLRPELPG